jgi:PII-like signaling protein
MSEPRKAVQVSVYLDEADPWQHRPLHMEMLKYLREHEVAGATVLRTVAGFTGHSRIKTSSLVDAGGRLPLLLTFIDTEEHAAEVLEHIREMAPRRLIVSEKVTLESGEIE